MVSSSCDIYINESLKFFSEFDNQFNLRLHHHYEIVKTHMIKDVSEPVNCVFVGISIYITTKCTRILKITQLFTFKAVKETGIESLCR